MTKRFTPAVHIKFAKELADVARQEVLSWFGGAVPVENKSDGGFDPVTKADVGAERRMRELIREAFPKHGIIGEELSRHEGEGRYCWSLDPIDGTRAFICGLPTWVILIALLEDGVPVLGIIDVPVLNERYVGHGGGAHLIDAVAERSLTASDCRNLAEARLSTTDPFLFAGAEAEAFERVRTRARLTRYGHDGYAYARLAAGTIDLVIESDLKPHDYNALIPVVRGAGGVIGDWSGGDRFETGQIVAAATPDLLDEAVALLASAAAA